MRKILCIVVLVLAVMNVAVANVAEAEMPWPFNTAGRVTMKEFMQFDPSARNLYCTGYLQGASTIFIIEQGKQVVKLSTNGVTFCAYLESKYGDTDELLVLAAFDTLNAFVNPEVGKIELGYGNQKRGE